MWQPVVLFDLVSCNDEVGRNNIWNLNLYLHFIYHLITDPFVHIGLDRTLEKWCYPLHKHQDQIFDISS